MKLKKVFDWWMDSKFITSCGVTILVAAFMAAPVSLAPWTFLTSFLVCLTPFFTVLATTILSFVVAGILDYSVPFRNWIGSCIQKLRTPKFKPITKIPTGRLEPFSVGPDVDQIDDGIALEVCQEVITDTLGRQMTDNESCGLLLTFDLPDGNTLAMFRYRRHVRTEKNGSFEDTLDVSVHVVKLQLSRIGDCILVDGLMSFDGKELEEVHDAKELLQSTVLRVVADSPQEFGEMQSVEEPKKETPDQSHQPVQITT
jgi:hypothetical protein